MLRISPRSFLAWFWDLLFFNHFPSFHFFIFNVFQILGVGGGGVLPNFGVGGVFLYLGMGVGGYVAPFWGWGVGVGFLGLGGGIPIGPVGPISLLRPL